MAASSFGGKRPALLEVGALTAERGILEHRTTRQRHSRISRDEEEFNTMDRPMRPEETMLSRRSRGLPEEAAAGAEALLGAGAFTCNVGARKRNG